MSEVQKVNFRVYESIGTPLYKQYNIESDIFESPLNSERDLIEGNKVYFKFPYGNVLCATLKKDKDNSWSFIVGNLYGLIAWCDVAKAYVVSAFANLNALKSLRQIGDVSER